MPTDSIIVSSAYDFLASWSHYDRVLILSCIAPSSITQWWIGLYDSLYQEKKQLSLSDLTGTMNAQKPANKYLPHHIGSSTLPCTLFAFHLIHEHGTSRHLHAPANVGRMPGSQMSY